jgi:hypothetical protein
MALTLTVCGEGRLTNGELPVEFHVAMACSDNPRHWDAEILDGSDERSPVVAHQLGSL